MRRPDRKTTWPDHAPRSAAWETLLGSRDGTHASPRATSWGWRACGTIGAWMSVLAPWVGCPALQCVIRVPRAARRLLSNSAHFLGSVSDISRGMLALSLGQRQSDSGTRAQLTMRRPYLLQILTKNRRKAQPDPKHNKAKQAQRVAGHIFCPYFKQECSVGDEHSLTNLILGLACFNKVSVVGLQYIGGDSIFYRV